MLTSTAFTMVCFNTSCLAGLKTIRAERKKPFQLTEDIFSEVLQLNRKLQDGLDAAMTRIQLHMGHEHMCYCLEI